MVKMEKLDKPKSPDTQTNQTNSSVTPFSIADILTRMERKSPDFEVTAKDFRLTMDHAKALETLRTSASLGFRPVSVLKYNNNNNNNNISTPMDLTKETSHQEVTSSVENVSLRYPNLQRVTNGGEDILTLHSSLPRSRSHSPHSDGSIGDETELDACSDKEDSCHGDSLEKSLNISDSRDADSKGGCKIVTYSIIIIKF